MPPRYTDEEVEARMVPQIVDAIYPVLIPMEQQDMRIQAENHAHITDIARGTWRAFRKPEAVMVYCVLCLDAGPERRDVVHIFSTLEKAKTFAETDTRNHVLYDYALDIPERLEERPR